ncbi:Similar to S.cerevisiae protein NOP15 (Constituent of 66S pre-ribosomal particles) [Malassezia sympodialis ATCC 42132]|uniref:Similar to S.cerevisiae protein NOP15 (Constituent of 66S pre-ribosomal particles) n=1 Tax=Malassezia sympodialis (strain ATCC 42132) TaxID=1230383 RepID=A0A1M8A764_MALS4|nr:Similar to S.cerevisiae protein NOP15 (Constituent of 66S pre-ribosomal particles) [Malassezia sympodialis ATCC 42132]
MVLREPVKRKPTKSSKAAKPDKQLSNEGMLLKKRVKKVKPEEVPVAASKASKKGKAVRIHEVPTILKGPSKKSASKRVSAPKVVEEENDAKDDVIEDTDEVDAEEDADDAEDDDEDDFLEGFSEDSDEEDEEDDALASRIAPARDEVVRLPSSRDDAAVRQRLEKALRKHAERGDSETGVVYIGRLPHGFFEDQLRAYFSQFGDIRRLRLSRNKKTGRSRHYGFMEFVSPEVAEIVVDTMNNYLLDGHLLQLSMIPSEEVHPNLWIGANRKYRRVPADRVERARRSRSRSTEERAKVNQKLLQRQKKRRAALERAGIEYDFPGYQI